MTTQPALPRYRGDVRAVYSGDDLRVLVDMQSGGIWKEQRVRLHGVDAPYAKHAKADSPAGKVREFVKQVTRGRVIHVEVVKDRGKDWIGVVYIETRDGLVNLNQELINQGYVFNSRREQNSHDHA